MNMLGRIWRAICDDYPDVSNTADTEEDEQEERAPEPGINCRWIEITARCRVPKNDSENWPSGCDSMCPARLQNEYRAEQQKQENMRFYQ